LTGTFQKLGITPLQLDKSNYEGKALLISDGKETKRIVVTPNDNIIEIKFTCSSSRAVEIVFMATFTGNTK